MVPPDRALPKSDSSIKLSKTKKGKLVAGVTYLSKPYLGALHRDELQASFQCGTSLSAPRRQSIEHCTCHTKHAPLLDRSVKFCTKTR